MNLTSLTNKQMFEYGEAFRNPKVSAADKHRYLAMAAKLFATADGLEKRRHLMERWVAGCQEHIVSAKDELLMREVLRNEALRHIVIGRY